MSNEFQNQYLPGYVSPSGETLTEILEERRMSQAELAQRMGIQKETWQPTLLLSILLRKVFSRLSWCVVPFIIPHFPVLIYRGTTHPTIKTFY